MGKRYLLRVAKCCFVAGGKIYLIRRADNGAWETPGGCFERGEDAARAAVREAREEIGIDATPGNVLVGRTTAHPTKPIDVREHLVMLRPRVAGQQLALDPKEASEGGWFTLEEALALEPRGNMTEKGLRWALGLERT